MARALWGLVVLCAAWLAGCGPSDRHRGGSATLVFDNESPYTTATVYVDGDELGRVEAESVRRFGVRPGRREVEVRRGLPFNPRVSRGYYEFRAGGEVELYDD